MTTRVLQFVDNEYALTGGASGSVLLDINDGTKFVLDEIEYPLPEPKPEHHTPSHGDGRTVSWLSYANRNVTIKMHVFGDTKTELSTNIRALMQMFQQEWPILEWAPRGWYESVYFDLVPPYTDLNTDDWFKTWIRDNTKHPMLADARIEVEAQPFLRGPKETVSLLVGNSSPLIPNGISKIIKGPENFKGDVPAPAEIFVDLASGNLWTDLLLGQRAAYSDAFEPIVEPTVGVQNFDVNRLNGDYRVLEAPPNIILNPSFETAGGGGADVFANWTETIPLTGSLQRSATSPYSGSWCCRMYDFVTTPSVIYLESDKVACDSSKAHSVALFWRGDSGTRGKVQSAASVYFYTGADVFISATPIFSWNLWAPGAWTYQFLYLLPEDFPAGTAKLSVWLGASGGGAASASSIYWDLVSAFELGVDTVEALFPLDSHEGRYLPCAGLSFGAANANDQVSINALLQTAAGEAITDSISPETVDLGDPNTVFKEIALFEPADRLPVISVPSHRVSALADKSNLVQVVRLATATLNTEDFWYDYLGLVPVDRAYGEVRNWSGNEHLIFDGRSSLLALTSLTGSRDDAQVWPITQQRGNCAFVADPSGFNGTIVAIAKDADQDHTVTVDVDVTMEYCPLYFLVPEEEEPEV